MDREAIDTWLVRAILGLVLGVLGFAALAFGGVRPQEFIVLWWLVIASLVLWMVRIWIAPKFRFLWPPVCWAIIPFVAYVIWRWMTADVEILARNEAIQIILCALLFLLVVNNLYGQESLRLLSFSLLALAMLIAMYGIFQWLRGSDHVWGSLRPIAYHGRASGTFICPNHLAGFLEMLVPLGIALTVAGRMKPLLRILLAYASFVGLVGVAATQSRGGWLSAATGLLFLGSFLSRKKGHRWIAVGLLLAVFSAGVWLCSTALAQRAAQTRITGHERDIRLRLWVSAWQMWKDYPWTGVGGGHFDSRFPQYREAVDKTQARPGWAHNDYLNTLADYGLIGFLLLVFPIAVCAWSVIRCWPHLQRNSGEFASKQSNRTAVVLGVSAGLVALLTHSLFDFNMHIPGNALLATVLLALLACHVRFATERYWFTARWPLSCAATAMLAGCLIFLGNQAWTRSRELVSLHKAEKMSAASEQKVTQLKSAFAIQPANFETALALGEHFRVLASSGAEDNQDRANEALNWFERAIALNKWEVSAYTRAGMCLDWTGKHDQAGEYFNKALALDPNYWQTRAMMGWHEFQMDHFAETRDWMLKSYKLNWVSNSLAFTYLELANQEIAKEKAREKPLR